MLFSKVFNKTYLHDQISLMYSFFDKLKYHKCGHKLPGPLKYPAYLTAHLVNIWLVDIC